MISYETKEEFLDLVDENALAEIEPKLRANRPVVRLTPDDHRCVHGYINASPLSADGERFTYFQFDRIHVDRSEPEPITGQIKVSEPDGSDARTVAECSHASVCQGVMQQWLGPTHRLGWQVRRPDRGWKVFDLDTEKRWEGNGQVRTFSPDGTKAFLQTPESLHLEAEEQGKTLAPEDVDCKIIDWETEELELRISVADVLEVHPEAEQVKNQHMIFKQTLFSPDGNRISFNFSNAWYARHRDEERRHEKLVANRDGTDITYLGSGATHPSWHPTGKYYHAVKHDENGVPRFVLYPVDGSEPQVLGPDWIAGGHPSFQPGDGRYMAVDYPRRHRGDVLLRIFDLQEQTWEDVLLAEYTDYSNKSGTHFHPAWSSDGRSIFISTAHTGIAGLYRLDL